MFWVHGQGWRITWLNSRKASAGFSCSKPSKRCEICSSKISPWETCVVATLTMMVSKLLKVMVAVFFMYKLYLEPYITSCISKWLFQVNSTFVCWRFVLFFSSDRQAWWKLSRRWRAKWWLLPDAPLVLARSSRRWELWLKQAAERRFLLTSNWPVEI